MKRTHALYASLVMLSIVTALGKDASAVTMNTRKEPSAVPAPTQPVSARTLEVLAAQNDSRNMQAAIVDKDGKADTKDLEAIVNKNLTTQVAANDDKDIPEPAPVVAPTPVLAKPAPLAPKPQPKPVPAPVVQAPQAAAAKLLPQPQLELPPEEAKGMMAVLMKIRVFAIRWREVLDIVFVGSIMIFTGLLYRVSQNQNFILARSVKAAEESARAAQRSANIAEGLYRKLEKIDENQAALDL